MIDSQQFVSMFSCDEARISKVGKTMFLILGWRKSTKDEDGSYWSESVGGQRIDFDYLDERCVAHGDTDAELMVSAQEYKRLCGMTMAEYLGLDTRPSSTTIDPVEAQP